MDWFDDSALTLAVFLPLLGAVAVAVLPRERDGLVRGAALAFSGLALLAGVGMLARFDYGAGAAMQFEVARSWIPSIGAGYHVGVDGIALPLLVLSLLLSLLCVVYSWRILPEPRNPMAFLALWLRSSPEAAGRTFDMLALQDVGAARFGGTFGTIVFAAVALGFAVKVPVWPLHTWLPDAHTEAPTVGSVLLAGILLKMGTYGFVRIALPILPEAARTWAPVIGVLGAIAIIYGALCCLAQRDVKRLIAFSSVGHMGFVMLGIATLTPIGINAAVFGMVAHGVITGMLFFLAGSMHERYHTRDIVELGGGMATLMPRLAGVFTLACIASLGLPGLAGFWGEILALLAAWNPAPGLSVPLFRTLAAVGLVGTLLTAGYFLWLIQRINLGRVPDRWGGRALGDLAPLEVAAWSPLIVLMVALGFAPGLILWLTNPSVTGWFTNLFA